MKRDTKRNEIKKKLGNVQYLLCGCILKGVQSQAARKLCNRRRLSFPPAARARPPVDPPARPQMVDASTPPQSRCEREREGRGKKR